MVIRFKVCDALLRTMNALEIAPVKVQFVTVADPERPVKSTSPSPKPPWFVPFVPVTVELVMVNPFTVVPTIP